MRRPVIVVLLLSTALGVTGLGPAAGADTPLPTPARAGKPNLTVTAVTAPRAVDVGDRVRLTARVRSTGAAAPASVTRLYLSPDAKHSNDDALIGSLATPRLTAGATTTSSGRVRVPSHLGPRWVIACADAKRTVTESDEADNCRAAKAATWVRAPGTPYRPGTPDPKSVTPSERPSAAVTRTVGPGGGTLKATSAGTTYTLVVPAKALVSDVAITMTPLTAVQGLGMSGGLVAGVDLQPNGLGFLSPVTLTIAGAPAVSPVRRTGFAYAGTGQDFHLYGLEPTSALTMKLSHFTGVGVGSATDADRSAQSSRVPLQSEAQWEQKLAGFKHDIDRAHQAAVKGDPNAQDLQDEALAKGVETMAGALRQVGIPKLRAALAGDTTRTGGPAIRYALGLMRQLSLVGADTAYQDLIDQLWELIGQVIDKMIPDALHRCVTEHNPYMALLMLSVARQQALLGSKAGDNPVPLVEMSKCLRFEVDFETQVDGDGYTQSDGGEDSTTFTDFGFHLRAQAVPVRVGADQIFGNTPLTGSGPEQYLRYYGDSAQTAIQYDDNGDPFTCHGTGSASGTKDGTFNVKNLDLDLNYYNDDPQFQKPFRLIMKIDPGTIGSDSAPADLTTYTADSGCFLPVGTVTNWYWGLHYYFLHMSEAIGEDASAYLVKDFTPGPSGSETLATKVYDRDVTGNTTEHELTTIVLRHTPIS